MMWVIIAVVLVALVVAMFAMRGRSKQADGMSTFKRQIDALSPEARRPTVDQVQKAAQDEYKHGPAVSPIPQRPTNEVADPSDNAESADGDSAGSASAGSATDHGSTRSGDQVSSTDEGASDASGPGEQDA